MIDVTLSCIESSSYGEVLVGLMLTEADWVFSQVFFESMSKSPSGLKI